MNYRGSICCPHKGADGPLRIMIRAKNRYPGVKRELDQWLSENDGLDDFRRELERVADGED